MEIQQGFTLWLTGMSGAGKSTLARYLAKRLPLVGKRVEVLDMGELEAIFPEAPDADKEIRDRNVRTLGWAAGLLTRNGVVPIVAAVSPYREVREEQRRAIGRFFEVFVDCPFEVLMERDSKGIYRRALSGELQDVVGVQAPYEPPGSAEVQVDMGRGKVEDVAEEVFDRLVNHGYLSRKERDILVEGSGPSKASKAKREAKIAAIRAAAKKAKKSTKTAQAKAGAKTTKAAQAKAGAKTTKAAASKAGAKTTKTTSAKAGAKTTKAAAAKAGAKTTKVAQAKAGAKTTKTAATKAGAKSTKTAASKAGAKTTKAAATKAGAKTTKAAASKAGAKTTKAAATKAGAKTTKAAASKAGSKATKAGAKKSGTKTSKS